MVDRFGLGHLQARFPTGCFCSWYGSSTLLPMSLGTAQLPCRASEPNHPGRRYQPGQIFGKVPTLRGVGEHPAELVHGFLDDHGKAIIPCMNPSHSVRGRARPGRYILMRAAYLLPKTSTHQPEMPICKSPDDNLRGSATRRRPYRCELTNGRLDRQVFGSRICPQKGATGAGIQVDTDQSIRDGRSGAVKDIRSCCRQSRSY